PTEPHHTPSPQAQQSPHHDSSSPGHLTVTTKTISTETPIEIPTLRQYFRRATQIAQSKALPTAADEPASLLRDDSQGEAFPTVSGLEAGHDRENIIKTSTLPHESTPRVTSLDAEEGSMQQQLQELTDLCTHLQRKQTEMATKIAAQDLEISSLKARIKLLKDRDKGTAKLGVQAVSVPPIAEVSTVGVPTAKDKGKEKMVESDTPKKKKLQEQIDVQMAREMKEKMAREDQRMDEQIVRDDEIARIHAEEELQMLIDSLDRNNEVIAKHLQEYEQSEAELTIGEKIELINELSEAELTIGEKIELINELVKYQDQKILKGMTLEEIREKFIPVWKKIEDFVPMALKEEGERVKRKGLKLEKGSAKKMKTSGDVSEEDLKEMMQLVHVEEVYVEAFQVKHPIIDWKIHTEGKRDYWKIIRLGGHTAVY
nr:hypothetical protein [Tanacetum cinerariifolium]